MISKIKNKIFPKKNQWIVSVLIDKINQIRKEYSSIVFYGSPTEGNWKGISNATVGLYPANSIEIPQWYSNPVLNNSEAIQFCAQIKALKFDKIIISGFAPFFFSWIDELLNSHTKIEVLYHGTISEFHDPTQQKFIEQLISFGKTKKINRFGFVKEGLAEVFSKLYAFDCYHQPLTAPIIPEGIKKIDLDKTKIHIGVFGADTFNKNLHNQVIHSLMIENVIVHVLDKSVFQYLGMGEQIVEHGKNLPREQFLSILGSMDLNLYMSFNESWGLVAKESEAIGVKTINNDNIDYINTIRLKLDK